MKRLENLAMVVQLDESQIMEFRDDTAILDESDSDDLTRPHRYDMTSYGVDFDIAGLVRRLDDGDIVIPDWQRRYVWNIKQASSFVESLLLGIPVPGIFLGFYPETGQLYVIDGQQRLKTLQFFYSGQRPPTSKGRSGSSFRLTGVDERYERLGYDGLKIMDRRRLDNSLIHATVVRQLTPPEDDTSMFQIFKRLNTGGSQVNAQEVRCAVYQGCLIETLKELNEYRHWRTIVGDAPSHRLKDQELILRFMAMWYDGENYRRPMVEFLNVFTQNNRNPDARWIEDASTIFKRTIRLFAKSMARRSFRVSGGRAVNAAVFDSMAVGLARRIAYKGEPELGAVKAAHDALIEREDYLRAISQATSSENSVSQRLRIATSIFDNA